MARGWYGVPATWRDAARRAGALYALGELRAARACDDWARRLGARLEVSP